MEKFISFLPKVNKHLTTIQNYLINYLLVQLVITSVSLPILANAGIPISYMSLAGNLIFIPIITSFLIISSILFFTELIRIPNTFLGYLLNKNSTVLERILGLSQKHWMIGFSQTNRLLFTLFPVISLIVMIKVQTKICKIIWLTTSLLTLTTIICLLTPTLQREIVPQTNNKLYLVQEKEKLILKDEGLFNTKASPQNYIKFELKPYLIKKYGLIHINNLLITKPGVRSFKAGQAICEEFPVDKVVINLGKKNISKYAWKCFFKMKKVLEKDGGVIVKHYN